MSDLQRAVDHLFDVAAGADFVFVLHVAADDTTLIGDVLQPVDEFVARAAEFAFLGVGRGSGEDQYGYAALGYVVDASGHGLRTALHVDQDGLGASCYLREALRGA